MPYNAEALHNNGTRPNRDSTAFIRKLLGGRLMLCCQAAAKIV